MELLLLFPLFAIGMLLASLLRGQRKSLEERTRTARGEEMARRVHAATTTKCPQCAEEIKIEAIKCRFCGLDVAERNQREMKSRESSLAQAELNYLNTVGSEDWWIERDQKFTSLSRSQKKDWERSGSPDLASWDPRGSTFEDWLAHQIAKKK